MELLAARTLRQHLSDNGPLEVATTVRVAIRVLAALEAAHNAGLIHRDVKPSNIMLCDDGRLKIADVPEAWNAKMQDFMGITPPTTALGALQDIHWSGGMIGYFPTYQLGNLISLQLWDKINADIPDLTEQITRGEFGALLTWLRTNLHQHGRKFTSVELLQRITGGGLNPAPYLKYLKAKFGDVYGL